MEPRLHKILNADGTISEEFGLLGEIHQRRKKLRLRQEAYNIGEQLNLLYDDIDAGVFGEQAKGGQFYQYVKSIKDQYPKS